MGDSIEDVEELPYIVWYQCRMCTHLFFDDIEKMLKHLDNKHGAMIDCEELRDTVFKNGLSMGGLPRVQKAGVAADDYSDEGLSPPFGHCENDEEDFLEKSPADVKPDNVKCANEEDGRYYAQNGDYSKELYEESSYENITGEEDCIKVDPSYAQFVHDDEEQLPEDDFEEDDNMQEFDEVDNGVHNTDSQETERLTQSLNYSTEGCEDFDQDVDDYQEDASDYDEITPEQLILEPDLDDGDYAESIAIVEDDEEEEEENNDSNTISNNENHQGSAIMNYGFNCRFCRKFFTTRRGVESHEQHHSNGLPVSVRRPTQKMFPCRICKAKAFQSFKDLKAHVRAHASSGGADRIHICKFCYLTFSNTASLTKHLTIHKRENPNKCFCGKTFVSANTLKIHRKIHSGIKPFTCEYSKCGRSFVTKSTLESHLRTHTGEKPYQCSHCPSSFTTSSAKYRHERHVHKIIDPQMK